MSDFLLEIYSEEIPAIMQKNAVENFKKFTIDIFEKNNVLIAVEKINVFITPRRLSLLILNLNKFQKIEAVTKTGPALDANKKAIEGFMKSVGVSSQNELKKITKNNKEYFAFEEDEKSKEISKLIAKSLPQILQKMLNSWPKIMRWNIEESNIQPKWIRPVRNIACLYGSEIVDFEYFGLKANDLTFGHLANSNKPLKITKAAHYRELLKDNFVILDQKLRKEKIISQIRKLKYENNFELIDSEESPLIDELVGLNENPTALLANIREEYLDLPKEVLILTLKSNQKYLCLANKNGELIPKFIFITNAILNEENKKRIIFDNEKVVEARLADSKFFIDSDLEIPLEDRLEDLKKIVYHQKLGSVYHKIKRINNLSKFLSIFIPHCDLNLVDRASNLAKADLSTKAVAELPELQGKIGSFYAQKQNEDKKIVDAIEEHYLPLGPNSDLPKSALGIALSIADKIDLITGFFLINEKPTSSKDPFALRRAALGIIRIGSEYNIAFPIRILVEKSLNAYPSRFLKENLSQKEEGKFLDRKKHLIQEIVIFFVERLKSFLKEREDLKIDIINAVIDDYISNLETHRYCDTLYLARKVEFLTKFIGDKENYNFIQLYKRSINILSIEEKKEHKTYSKKPSRLLFQTSSEKILNKRIKKISRDFNKLITKGEFENAFKLFNVIEMPLKQFFDDNFVNVKEANIRENRLNLLSQIRNLFNKVIDFSRIDFS